MLWHQRRVWGLIDMKEYLDLFMFSDKGIKFYILERADEYILSLENKKNKDILLKDFLELIACNFANQYEDVRIKSLEIFMKHMNRVILFTNFENIVDVLELGCEKSGLLSLDLLQEIIKQRKPEEKWITMSIREIYIALAKGILGDSLKIKEKAIELMSNIDVRESWTLEILFQKAENNRRSNRDDQIAIKHARNNGNSYKGKSRNSPVSLYSRNNRNKLRNHPASKQDRNTSGKAILSPFSKYDGQKNYSKEENDDIPISMIGLFIQTIEDRSPCIRRATLETASKLAMKDDYLVGTVVDFIIETLNDNDISIRLLAAEKLKELANYYTIELGSDQIFEVGLTIGDTSKDTRKAIRGFLSSIVFISSGNCESNKLHVQYALFENILEYLGKSARKYDNELEEIIFTIYKIGIKNSALSEIFFRKHGNGLLTSSSSDKNYIVKLVIVLAHHVNSKRLLHQSLCLEARCLIWKYGLMDGSSLETIDELIHTGSKAT
eukprot:GHVP01032227.1.p1 GENE.GHVP01032227.1~~GHVP01032227.1.p1  ORF type:complete len:496 (+),score=65.85 GHVP01032227.1:1-1488(+)